MEPMERIITRFTRALDTYDRHADAQQQICRRLCTLLTRHTNRHFRRALEIGCGTGCLTRLLKENCVIDEWLLNDLCEGCQAKIATLFTEQMPPFIVGDAEKIKFPRLFDLIVSASAFQWMENPGIFLGKLARMLRPRGTLLFNTFAPGNLEEIQQLTGCGLTYPPLWKLNKWLNDDYRILFMQEEEIILTFDTPLDVLRHLKHTGVTATSNGAWTRGRQQEFCREYIRLFSTDTNKVRLTYRPLYVLAVKKQ